MATSVVVRSQPIARDKLKQFLPSHELIKAFENLAQDVSTTLPEAIDGNTEAVETAQATANAALVQAAAAQADADAAQATVDALALRDVPLALTDAATILVDAEFHNSFSVTLGGNRALDAPSHLVNGMLLNFAIRQDGTGNRTLTFNAIYDFGAAGVPVLSTTASTVDYVFGYYDSTSNKILATFRKAVSTASTFSAYNGAAQAIPNAANTKVSLPTEAFDIGANFASSAWTPPAGRPVMMVAGVAIPATAGTECNIMIFKNGAEFKRGAQLVSGGAANAMATVTCLDIPNGTDVYEVYFRQATGVAQNTFGGAALTYFQGTTIQA